LGPVHVTEAEAEILEALWRSGPLPARRLIAQVQAARPWGAATIKTLLGRLMHKQIVRSERDDGLIRYRPLIEREAYVDGEVKGLVDRLFGGDPARLAAFLAARGESGQ
jgi:predicted transcriptional regulator